jgi:hypothetical protein
MTPSDEQYPKGEQCDMKDDCLADLQVHSEFDMFQKCVKDNSVNEFTGFIGAIGESSVRLYPNFNLTFYYTIPIDQILYVKKNRNDPDESVSLFVRTTADVKSHSATSSSQVATVKFLRTASRSRAIVTPVCEGLLHTIEYLKSMPPGTPGVSEALHALQVSYDQSCL